MNLWHSIAQPYGRSEISHGPTHTKSFLTSKNVLATMTNTAKVQYGLQIVTK